MLGCGFKAPIGEEMLLWKRCTQLVGFEKSILHRAGVSKSVVLDGAKTERGEDWNVNDVKGLVVNDVAALGIGLGAGRVNIVREMSRLLEWRGWLGLGNRHGWSEGRRGGECRKEGVWRGLYGDSGITG
jgi:hypothetical protein